MSDRGRDHGPLPKLYSIFRGEVASLQPYGAFVKIPHTRKNGLVHKTQISKMKIDNPSEVLTVGDMVYCKVISLGEAGEEKISLSMKVVNQDSGKDLDENLIITKQEELRRKKGLPPVQDKIELGAVLNTTCKKCGMKGHLTQDCFKLPGDKSYDLIPELDLETLHQPPVHREKKEKKKKIKHKKKRKKNITSSSEEDTSSEEERTTCQTSHKERKKKRKKRKKEKLVETSSDSSLEKEQIKKVGRKDSKRTFVKKDDSSPSYKHRTNSSDEEDYRESTHRKKRKKSHDDERTEVGLKENSGDRRFYHYHNKRTDHTSEHNKRHSKSSKCEKEVHSNGHDRR